METNSSGDTSTQPKEVKMFCIRHYVAEVRRKDWKKCCPFNLSRDSAESNHLAERVFVSLILEDNDALVNTPENIEAPNSLQSFDVGNLEVQAAVSETHTDVVIANDAPINSIGNDALITVNDTPLELASCNVTYSHSQNEQIINGATVAADNDVAADNNKPEDVVVDDDSLKGSNIAGASKSSSSKLKEKAQYQNKKNISEDTIAAGKDKHKVDDDDDEDDGAYTISDEERNLAGEKPKKFRLLSDILKNLAGPCDAASAGYVANELSSESEDDSDEFTPDTSGRKKKGFQVASSKSWGVSKNTRGSRKLPERSCNLRKRMKPVPIDSSLKDPEVGSKRPWRKARTRKVDLQVMNKFETSSAEIIVHGSTSGSQKVAPSSVGGGEKRSGILKNSLVSSGSKRTRETMEDDSGRDFSKPLRSHRRFTGENSLTATHGEKDAQFVQPTIAVLKNIETDSVRAQNEIREDSPPIDNESMAALQLIRLFNSGVTTHASSKTATSDPAIPVSKGEISIGLKDKLLSASGSTVGQSHEEINMIITDEGVPQAEQIESGTPVCAMNMNPSEFSIANAKKHMRRVKAIQK